VSLFTLIYALIYFPYICFNRLEPLVNTHKELFIGFHKAELDILFFKFLLKL